MGKNTSITLSDHFQRFIASEIASGRFGNVSEVVRAGLRRLEEDEEERVAIRAALAEGENSGIAEGYSIGGLLAELNAGTSA